MHPMEKTRNQLLNNCILCGKCIRECKAVSLMNLNEKDYGKIQSQLIKSLKTGTVKGDVRQKVYGCMECFACTGIECPAGIDVMSINRAVKYFDRDNPAKFTEEDQQKIKTNFLKKCRSEETGFLEEKSDNPEILFFPGCNVYNNPDILRDALKLMDIIGPFSFLPGIDNCCGINFFCAGDVNRGMDKGKNLVRKIKDFNPKTLVFWCPTCICNYRHLLQDEDLRSIEILTFGQYLLRNFDKLDLRPVRREIRLTLHEPCKTSYTGIDTESVREILARIPGVKLTEMEHHGKNTLCCGSGASAACEDTVFAEARKKRLREAEDTKADILIDVCHYCHHVFTSAPERSRDLAIENYACFLAGHLACSND